MGNEAAVEVPAQPLLEPSQTAEPPRPVLCLQGTLAFAEGLVSWVAVLQARKLNLHPYELRPVGIPVLLQPVGVDQARTIRLGVLKDVAEEGSLDWVHGFHPWLRRKGRRSEYPCMPSQRGELQHHYYSDEVAA